MGIYISRSAEKSAKNLARNQEVKNYKNSIKSKI